MFLRFIVFLFIVSFFSCSEPPENIGVEKSNEVNKRRQKFENELKEAGQSNAPREHSRKSSNSLEDIFVYDLPSHWRREVGTQFRLFNFSFGKTGQAYLSFSKGNSGGLLANINRWRQQVGYNKITEEEINQSTKEIIFFNRPARYLDLQGDYKPVRGDKKSNWRVLGVLFVDVSYSFFLKMTGSADEVAKEKLNFEKLCRSFSIKKEQVSSGHHEHKGLDLHFSPKWKVKKTEGIVYLSATKGDVKVTVTRLNKDGGGVEANYKRWCRQLGLKDIPNLSKFP